MNSTTRTLAVIPPALVVTTLLITIMVSLIAFNGELPERVPRVKIPEVLMPPEEVVEPNPIKKPVPPMLEETPPPTVLREPFDGMDATGLIAKVAPPEKINPGPDLVYGHLTQADGEYLPIMCVAPVYPERARTKGIEGNVVVEFVVMASGATRSPVVVSSTSSLFERAAMQAALKCKFKPRVIDGAAREVPNVRRKFSFKMST